MQRLNVEYIREDDRGSLIQISSSIWKQINYIILNKNEVLGGHYHKHKKELFYLAKGKVKVNDVEIINPNECFMINPLEKHTIYALENSELVELLSEPFDKKDIFIDE